MNIVMVLAGKQIILRPLAVVQNLNPVNKVKINKKSLGHSRGNLGCENGHLVDFLG